MKQCKKCGGRLKIDYTIGGPFLICTKCGYTEKVEKK